MFLMVNVEGLKNNNNNKKTLVCVILPQMPSNFVS